MSNFTLQTRLPTWRRLALSTWKQSDDPQIFGWLDIDASALLAYVAELRASSGKRVTVTHVVGKAAALAFAENPDCNAVACASGLRRRKSVDVFFSVAVNGGKNLSGAKVEHADRLSTVQIAQALHEHVSAIRDKGDSPLQKSQNLLSRFPSWLLRPTMLATALINFDLGLDLSSIGIPHDPFGTVVVTNVGVLGVEQGFAPLIPSGRNAAMLTVGKIRDKVIAVDGQAVVRPVLTIGGTFDHRVVDGVHLGKISAALTRVLSAPADHLGTPSEPLAARPRPDHLREVHRGECTDALSAVH